MALFREAFLVLAVVHLEAAEAPPQPKHKIVRMAVDSPAQTSLLQTASRESVDVEDQFVRFKSRFGRNYKDSSEEQMRQQIFQKRLAWIEAHNSKGASWHAEVNQFADRTEEELQPFRGFKKPRKAGGSRSARPSSLLQSDATESYEAFFKELEDVLDSEDSADTSCSAHQSTCHESKSCCVGLVCGAHGICENPEPDLPESKDWSFLETAQEVADQGECGSCWAVAAAGVIQLQAARMSGKEPPRISPQSMLGCTPNHDECGGTGGCDGATPELAFKWAKQNGLRSTVVEKYLGQTMCPKISHHPSAALVGGFVKLPVNKADPVINALYTVGPLAVAVAAGDWFQYSGGVFKCVSDLTVDHAVVMIGYGVDKGVSGLHSHPYWKIRNSWGEDWGESGFIRIARHPGREPCGTDYDMQKGIGCKNDPKVAKVCGECGVLSDVAYPIAVNVSSSNVNNRVRSHRWDRI